MAVEQIRCYNILSSRLCDQRSFPENTEGVRSIFLSVSFLFVGIISVGH